MSKQPAIPQHVAVECPVCFTRLTPRPGKTPRQIKCPDCYTPVRVPSLEEVIARLPKEREEEVVGRYELGAAVNPHVDVFDASLGPSVGSYRLEARAPLVEPPSVVAAAAAEATQVPAQARGGRHGARARATDTSHTQPSIPDQRRADRSASATRARSASARSMPDVTCPGCGASIDVPLSEKPQSILCPKCLEDVTVPARRALPAGRDAESKAGAVEAGRTRRPSEPATRERRQDEPRASATSGLDEPIVFAEAPPPTGQPASPGVRPRDPEGQFVNVFDALAVIRQEEFDPPPKWTFFSRVWTFPWRPGSLGRWVYSMLNFTLFSLVLIGFVWLAGMAYWPLVLVVFLPMMIAAGGLAMSYASANFLPVLIDTAAGNDRVRTWHDPDWKEWSVWFMYLVCMAFTAGLFGHVVAWFSAWGVAPEWPYAPVLALTTFLAFPIVILSSQEANSPFVPLSLPILKSLFTCWWGWLMFYVLSALVVGSCAGLIMAANRVSPYLALSTAGIPLATVFLLYPRLLGRLAWRASLVKRRRKGRRVQTHLPAAAGKEH